MNDQEHIGNIYILHVQREGRRSYFVERAIGVNFREAGVDDLRNEPYSYKALFIPTYSLLIVNLYMDLMAAMRGKRFENSDDELTGLAFLKAVIMRALGIYQADRSNFLAKFANEFDRLDVPSVRHALHQLAQVDPPIPM